MKTFYAYLAGFLDADGSIYCRLKPNLTYKYDFQVAPSVVFFQNQKAEKSLKLIQKKLESAHDFVQLAQMIDKFGVLNYSKKRTILASVVRHHLIEKGILTP